MIRDRSIVCRILASVTWLLSLGWFGVTSIASYGFTPVGFLFWCLPAWPLFGLTVSWWQRAGIPMRGQTIEDVRRRWKRCAWGAVGAYVAVAVLTTIAAEIEYPTFDLVLGPVVLIVTCLYLVLPIALTIWALWTSARRPVVRAV